MWFCSALVWFGLGLVWFGSALKEMPPNIVIVAHNGIKFDFPFLCSECFRNGIYLENFAHWRFVDTLEVVRALGSDSHGGCVKLQCLLRHLTHKEEL